MPVINLAGIILLLLSFNEIIGHLFNIIYILGFVIKNMMWLRIAMITGAVIEIFYYYLIKDPELAVNIMWCSVWIGVNAVQMSLLISDKLKSKFNDEEARIYELAFRSMDRMYFRKVMDIASWIEVEPGKVIVEENKHINNLYLIYSGIAEVRSRGEVFAYLRDGNFAGEMSFITGGKTTAEVATLTSVRLICWDKASLTALMNRTKEIDEGLKGIFNLDLVKKLVKKPEKV